MTDKDMTEKIHHGRNVRRFRELLDMKQEALAIELGGDWTQRRISLLEQKETIESDILEEVAKALKVPVKAIENFDEKGAVTYFNTFQEGSTNQGTVVNYGTCNFNPLDELMKSVEENKRLNEETKQLYAALLREKEEKIAWLEKLLQEKMG